MVKPNVLLLMLNVVKLSGYDGSLVAHDASSLQVDCLLDWNVPMFCQPLHFPKDLHKLNHASRSTPIIGEQQFSDVAVLGN